MDYLKNPLWILALGGAIGLALWGLFAGLSLLAPALGIMASLATTGAAAGFTIAPMLGTVASYGAAASGAALSILLVVRIAKEAKKEPLVWGTPILGVLSGFLTQMCEQFWEGPKFMWLIFSVAVALLVVIGGVLYSLKARITKVCGAVCTLVAPLAVIAATAQSKPEALTKFLSVGAISLWLPLVALLLAALVLGILANAAAKSDA